MNVGTDTPFFEADAIGIGRAVLRGAIIAGLAVAAFMTVVGVLIGAGLGASLAMAAFAALWGGPGFGGMLGAVIHVSRHRKVVSTSAGVTPADEHQGDEAPEPSRVTTVGEPELVGALRSPTRDDEPSLGSF